MAFFQQLRLLLWKNWLTVIRQPVWSLILIIWPLIIFIIIAVTRSQFPPLARDTCYVGPRNLPSTGFFPFLQTLMCNTDSNCHNKSRLSETKSQKSATTSREQSFPNGSPLESLYQGGDFSQMNLPKNFLHDPVTLIEVLNKIIGTPHQARPTNGSLSNITLSDPRNLSSLLQSMDQLRRAICTMTLPLVNTSSHDPFTYSLVNFCKTNDTALEISLLTLNQILTGLMSTNPDEMVTAAGMSLLMIDHLQNETVLWESLLAIPQLFSRGSMDEVLATVEGLLISIKGAMNKIESNFPETGASFATVRPLIAAGINLVDYIQNWPGKDVSISLSDVVTFENGSFGGIAMQVLKDVQIPLGKAIGLTMDKSMVHSHLCDNGSNSLWLSTACSTGTLDMVLRWISPEKVAKQILLTWSRNVALHDLSFAKSLIGGLATGESNCTRRRRSEDTQPQNIDEELFLEVGKVVLAIVKLVPEVDMVVQSVLQTGFQSLMTGTLALDTVKEMMDNVLKDAMNLQWVYLTLMTNQTVARVWIDHALDSVLEGVIQMLGSENLTCNNILEPFEWLLNTKSIDIEVWRSVICQNSSTLDQALLMDWLPLIQEAQEVYAAITSRTNVTATLPTILSEWHKMQESSMQFELLLNRLLTELGEPYLMTWMQVNGTQDVVGTLQQSVLSFMVDVGETIETMEFWPCVKNYFHALYWILNYRPGVTTQPANCSANFFTSALTCDTGLEWPQFVQTVTQALMSPNQDFVSNGLKGTLHFLQHVYGDIYKIQAITFLNQELSQGGDVVSGYLRRLLIHLDAFLRQVSTLPDSSLSNPDVMAPSISSLFESVGLGQMLPLLFSDSPVNISTVLDIASKIGRENQQYVNFNETDPTLPELERLIMHFLSMEGNLTIALPHIMGHSLLTYSDYFHPDLVAKVREFIQPFTNKTSTGAVEAILSSVELLKTVTDANNGDPAFIILGYIRQFQELVMSMFRLRRIKQVALPSGQLTAGQVTDLHLLSQDFLKLLTPEVLQNLTQAGPDAAQTIVIQKFVAFLPSAVQHEAARFLNDFKSLQYEMSRCATGQDCLDGISEILHFLDQIFEMMLSGNGTVTMTVAATNRFLEGREYEELERVWFSLLLAPKDSAAVQTSRQILHLVKLLMATPNVSVSDVQNALRQSNLTLEELNDFAALAGAGNFNNLTVNLMEIINTRKCFEPQNDMNVTAQCALSLIHSVSTFLTQVPELHNQTAFLSLIPLIVNATFEDFMKMNFSSEPCQVFVDTLNITLANIKLSLQLNHLNTPEIMNEIKVVERLMQLITNMEPFNNTDSAFMQDPMYAQHVNLQIVQWYLNKLENITSNSSISELLQPFFYMTQMQVALQLAQANFSLFVSNQVQVLINSLQHPIDGAGVSKIGVTVVQILHHLFDFLKVQLEVQGDNFGSHSMFNTTTLNAVETQIKQYLSLTENWMKQPNVQLVLTNMLQWGNPSINMSSSLTDIQHLLKTMVHFLSNDEQVYLSIISNITHTLKQALSASDVENALSTLTLEELNDFAALAGASNFNNLTVNLMEIINTRKCFEPQHDLNVTAQCALSLVHSVSTFLTQVPELQNQTAFLSLIPLIVNTTFEDVMKIDFSSHPCMVFVDTLNITLANIKLSLELNHLNSPEIMNEIKVVERLMQLITNMESFNNTDSALMQDPMYAQHVILQIVHWHLNELENITSNSSISELLQPFFYMAQMQVAYQLAEANFSLFVSNQVQVLINSLQHPIDGAGVSKIGVTVVQILHHLFDFLKVQLEVQGDNFGLHSMFNTTTLNAVETQIKQYLSLTENWMKQPNVQLVLTNMLQWGNPSINMSAPLTDIQHLLKTMVHFLSNDEQVYLSIISNITHTLKQALSASDVQNALSTLTLEELNDFAALAGASNFNNLTVNLMEIINTRKCFEPQHDLNVTAQCALSLVHSVSTFLTQVPELQNQTAFLSLIPLIVNTTFEDVMNIDFSSQPCEVFVDTLNITLANIKLSLQLNHLNSPEIMNEIKVVERLMQLITNMESFNNTDSALMQDPMYAQHVILQIVQWYLNELENITSNSSISELLQPFFYMAQMQVEIQLAQANFSLFVSNQVQVLINSLQQPIDGAGVSKIGVTFVQILHHFFDFLKLQIGVQGDNFGSHSMFNTTTLNAFETQIKQYLNLTENWMKQPNVQLVLTNMLQWGNPSINMSAPLTDVQHLLKTMVHFLSEDERVYFSIISNITHSLKQAIMVAEQPGGLQSDHFLDVIFTAAQPLTMLINLPAHLKQNMMEIVEGSLQFLIQPNMSYASSRATVLLILNRTESIVQETVAEEFAVYLLPGLKIATTYFRSIATISGPDSWNQMILNEMETIQSFLPPNCTAQAYISAVINITQFILMSGQGNMSLWASFENASIDKVPMIIGQLCDHVSNFLMGIPELPYSVVKSVKLFAHLTSFLNQMINGQVDEDMWEKPEKMLQALLFSIEGTELWHNISSVVPLFEKIMGDLVKEMQAESAMIHSLQLPLVTLITDVLLSVNSSSVVLSEVMERIQFATKRTVQAAQQANGTLNCSDALTIWEPVRQATGLSPATMYMWCNTTLQPVLEAYAEPLSMDSYLNKTEYMHMGVEPMTANATAARIVKIVWSLYQADLNQTHVIEQLIEAVSDRFSVLAGWPLSLEAQQHWYNQLQDQQLQNSVSSINMLSEELLDVAPFLHPYIKSVEEALIFIVNNSYLLNSSSSEDLGKHVAMIFLTSANMSSADIFSMIQGNFSTNNEAFVTDMLRKVVEHMTQLKILGEDPMVYNVLEQFLMANDTSLLVKMVSKLFAWLTSTEASGEELLMQLLPKMYEILQGVLSLLNQMNVELPVNAEVFEGIARNLIAMLKQNMNTNGSLPPMGQHHGMYLPQSTYSNNTVRIRHKREAPMMPQRDPMDDFTELFSIDYPAMFKALAVPPSTGEIMETIHVFFANPDLNVVLKGATSDMPWGLETSQEESINAALGVLSLVTLPAALEMSSLDLLANAVDMIPDSFPFSSLLKNITGALANESQENLLFMEQTFETITELLQISETDQTCEENLAKLKDQVCVLENMESVHLLLSHLSIERGLLCDTIMPGLQTLFELLMTNTSALTDAMFQTFIGEPMTYGVEANWTVALSESLGFNISSLHMLNINISSPGMVTIAELLRDENAFVLDVHRHMDFNPGVLDLLMNSTLPNNNLEILSWLVSLHQCSPTETMRMTDMIILETFCSMSPTEWYSFVLLMVRHVNTEKLIYRVVLSEELQSLATVMLDMAEAVVDVMNKIIPTISQLQTYLLSMKDIDPDTTNEFSPMTRGQTPSNSNQATFVTLSRALCSKGIIAVFGITKLTTTSHSSPSSPQNQKREEMIERFKIPRNATPFCMNMYLDMVNTTGGAIAWAFLKPMLMGQILFTPDTPVTRNIMEKANTTLQEFANLRKQSQDWIKSSNYIINSAETLSHTLPMLQNSLSNPFVKNFIQMQTDINVDRMKETLKNFSNITVMLENNRQVLDHITTLSNLMVDLSSCIQFDRYRGYNSEEQLNTVAQELAKNRNLYASIIFKLPKDKDSSRKRHARASSTTSSLPPQISYTIRMHMDNVMRTDRVRNPYFVKDTHIVASLTMRYNRGFIYLQENIDRAIIETHAGHRVTEPAVQLQPFPYPCHLRDEYLEAISFVFPIMLMLAWVLFVADFVKKLVHERELRLHEYMKMMGVNPVSHFFAWFLECASYLTTTIFILTLVMKCGKILPHSDGFLLFLYFCDYGLSILAFSYLVSSFFDRTYIAGLSGSLLYILFFFPFIVVMALETNLSFSQKSILGLFSPTCFSHASQYVSRYEAQGEGIQWKNSYTSPIAGDTASFGWLCWLMVIDSILYFVIGAYIRMVFPGKYGIPAPWYFPFKSSFWADLCCSIHSKTGSNKGLLFTNVMQKNQPVLSDDKGKGKNKLSFQAAEDFSELPIGVILHGLSKIYGDRVAIENLNISFHEGHVTSLLGHNGAGKTTTMSLLTGLFAPSSGTIEVYGRDMQRNIDDIRKELGVCMQYDVLFDHMTAKEHLLLYGQIKAPHWTRGVLHEQVRTILEETGMYAHRHKRVGTLSGGMKRKLSISIAFIGGSRLVVLDEPTTGVDPCSRRSIWDIVIQHKKHRTIIMSTHHLDEAEVLSDRIAFLEKGGLKCCGSPFTLKDKLGQGYKLTLTKKKQSLESEEIDSAELKEFIQAHVPEARLKETQGGDIIYSLPTFTSSNASSYRSLLTALDANLNNLQLGGYGVSDTTLEEVFLELTQDNTDSESVPLSISETISDTASLDSFSSDSSENLGDKIKLTGSSTVSGMALLWQQITAILVKRFQHSHRDWKGLISQILLPVLFVVCAMGLGSIKNDLRHYPEMVLSPALYNIGPSYSFFSNQNPTSRPLVDAMMSFPGIDNACLDKSDNLVCTRNSNAWTRRGNTSGLLNNCKCTSQGQVCDKSKDQLSHKKSPSSQDVYNLTGINVQSYLVNTANDFIRNRYGGFEFGMQLPADLQIDLQEVPKNRTLSKVWFNPEGHHTMPAYMNSLNNLILRTNLPADKDPTKYAISVSSHPYFGRPDDEDAIVQGMLQMLVALCVLTGFSITTASFAIYEVSEHHSGAKRLQHIGGISEPLYWAVNFLYDMAIYLIPVTFTVAVIAAFQIPAFTERQNLGAITLLFVLFGFATFPWMYLLAGIFKDAEMAFITYVCINLFVSVNTIMSTSILYFLGQIVPSNPELIKAMFERMFNAFLIFPQFNFGNGLLHLTRKNIEVQILSGYGIDAYQNPFYTEAFKKMFVASFIQGLVFFTLRLLLNKFIMRKVRLLICGKTLPQVAPENEDEDVTAEHRRVSSGAASTDILQVNQLTKVYQHLNKKVHAVQRLSVGIPAGECFGLLGVNGAGKTTTFKMLTGDVSPTDGTAQIRDWDGQLMDIMECRYKGINIGYCPQVDALDNLLTGEEHLYFYARIRGIAKREIDRVVSYLLRRLELNYHRNIITDGYSCGTRRKLSTALALLGHPQILLLDEPSSGMDPRTKRHLWKIISEEVKGKCAVVLTSHSMEECEALCSRLAIMVKGQFRCLGSLQHIKNRFGRGFTVKMYLAGASYDAEAITVFMQCRFPSTYLKDQHSTMVEYHVPVAPGGVADIFDQLESNKTALQIKHFSVSQTTLDEVFINFAMENIGMDTMPIDDEGDDADSLETVET